MRCEDAAKAAKKASVVLGSLGAETKNSALGEIRAALLSRRESVLEANRKDLERSEQEGLAPPLLARLRFDGQKLAGVCDGIDSLLGLPDPVGRVLSARELDAGLELYRTTCPIGVIGVIFESRPDALVQISTLCLKSGNAVILKGGREALETNRVLADTIAEASAKAGLPEGWIHLLETREEVNEMLALHSSIDLIIPRGSNEFVRHIMKNTLIPVMGHADGLCHLYVDEDADRAMAVRLAVDSKTQYVAVCNAIETLLVHRGAAAEYLPLLKKAMDEKHVELRGCDETRKIIPCSPATEEDWKTEYLDYILSIKIVGSLDEAVDHINIYGSRHTDAIATRSREKALRFMDRVDSADVIWNASTRFADGYRYGLGAEVGISTGKLHARGPVGLEGLVIYKWRLFGSGQIVADYSGPDAKTYTHRDLTT